MIITVTLNPAVDKKLSLCEVALGEKNIYRGARSSFSGKGINAARALRALGADVTAAGFLGADNADGFLRSLESEGVKCDFNVCPGETRVNYKLTEKNGRETELNGLGFNAARSDEEAFLDNLGKYYGERNVLVLSGSLPPGVSRDIYAVITREAKKSGTRVVLDSSGPAFKHGAGAAPFAAMPNLFELSEYVKPLGGEALSVAGKAGVLAAQNIDEICVSCGKDGAVFFKRGAAPLRARYLKRVKRKETVGAGDALCAAYVYAVLNGFDFADTARFCVAAATAFVALGKAANLKTVNELTGGVAVEACEAP